MPIQCSSEDKAVLIVLTMPILKAPSWHTTRSSHFKHPSCNRVTICFQSKIHPLHSNLMVVSQQVQGQNMSLSPISWKPGRLFILYRLTQNLPIACKTLTCMPLLESHFILFLRSMSFKRSRGKATYQQLHKKMDKMTIKHPTSNYCPPPTDVQPTTSTGSVHQVNTTIHSRSLWLFLAPSLSFFHRFSKTTPQKCKLHKGECNSDWQQR